MMKLTDEEDDYHTEVLLYFIEISLKLLYCFNHRALFYSQDYKYLVLGTQVVATSEQTSPCFRSATEFYSIAKETRSPPILRISLTVEQPIHRIIRYQVEVTQNLGN